MDAFLMFRLDARLSRVYRSILSALNKRIQDILVADIVAVAIVGVYAGIFSYLTILRYYAFYAHAWDLGNYNQAMYTTLYDHKIMHYPSVLAANPSSSILGVHFAVILFLLLPLYALLPRPETLLVIQSIFLGLGALPVYKLAQRRLRSNGLVLALSGLYLLNPAIQGINWVDFHPEAFVPVFVLSSIYFMDARKWKLYTVSVLLTLSTMEPAAFLVLLTAIYYAWRNRTALISAMRAKRFFSTEFEVFAGTSILSIAWLAVALTVIRSYTPHELTLFGGLYTWQTLGARSLLVVPLIAITNPIAAFNALVNNIGQKILYLISLLGTLGFLPLASLSLAAIGFAWLGVGLLSDNPVYYSLGTQYPAFTIPYVMSAFVLTAQKLSRRGLRLMIIYTALASAILSPLTFGSLVAYPYSGPYGVPSVTQHNTSVISLIGLIPPNATVLTQDNLFPFVSSRAEAYVIPTRSFFPVGTSFDSQLALYVDRAQFVLLDPVSDYVPAYFTFPLLKSAGFGLAASSDGAYLFERGFSGAPQTLGAFSREYNYTNLSLLCCRVGSDQDALSKSVFLHDSSYGQSPNFWTGPWLPLPAGDYRVTFRLKTLATTPGNLISIGIITYKMNVGELTWGIPGEGVGMGFGAYADPTPTIYSLSPVTASNFTSVERYQSFSFSFRTSNFQFAMFPGLNVSQSAALALDNVVFVQQDITL